MSDSLPLQALPEVRLVSRIGSLPPIHFLHNLRNKRLSPGLVLQDIENKGDNFQDLLNKGVVDILALGGTILSLVDSVST
jgi:hypothetical protein